MKKYRQIIAFLMLAATLAALVSCSADITHVEQIKTVMEPEIAEGIKTEPSPTEEEEPIAVCGHPAPLNPITSEPLIFASPSDNPDIKIRGMENLDWCYVIYSEEELYELLSSKLCEGAFVVDRLYAFEDKLPWSDSDKKFVLNRYELYKYEINERIKYLHDPQNYDGGVILNTLFKSSLAHLKNDTAEELKKCEELLNAKVVFFLVFEYPSEYAPLCTQSFTSYPSSSQTEVKRRYIVDSSYEIKTIEVFPIFEGQQANFEIMSTDSDEYAFLTERGEYLYEKWYDRLYYDESVGKWRLYGKDYSENKYIPEVLMSKTYDKAAIEGTQYISDAYFIDENDLDELKKNAAERGANVHDTRDNTYLFGDIEPDVRMDELFVIVLNCKLHGFSRTAFLNGENTVEYDLKVTPSETGETLVILDASSAAELYVKIRKAPSGGKQSGGDALATSNYDDTYISDTAYIEWSKKIESESEADELINSATADGTRVVDMRTSSESFSEIGCSMPIDETYAFMVTRDWSYYVYGADKSCIYYDIKVDPNVENNTLFIVKGSSAGSISVTFIPK